MKTFRLYSLMLLALIISGSKLAAQQIDSSYTLNTKSGKVTGTLTIPEPNNGKVVLIVPGSGPTDRDGNNNMGLKTNAYALISKVLLLNQVASLRYDKKGIGKSTAVPEEDLTFDEYVSDVVGWVKKLKADGSFKKIYLLGHSEGALIAMLAAQKEPVDGLVSVAGPALPADSLLLQQLSRQPGLYELAKPAIDSLKTGKLVNQPPPMMLALFRKSVQPYLINWFRYDPLKEIKKLKVPILILHGSDDIQVPSQQAAMLADAADTATEWHLINGMNHVLKQVNGEDELANMSTYSNPNLPLHPEFKKQLLQFVDKY